MKIQTAAIILLIMILSAACTGKGSSKQGKSREADSSFVGDSIVKYYSNRLLLKEVTFKDGVRNGLTKTYYPGGQLYQTFWYVNDLKEDSARWYYLEGQLFRTTPFRHDTIDGIQKQFYRTGEVRAKIGYQKGLRNQFFQEFTKEGKLVGGYPDVVTAIQDNYKAKGLYLIDLELSNKSTRVKFYQGELNNELFDTTLCKSIKTTEGKGTIVLKKSGSAQPRSINIIAEIITPFGNRYLLPKKIALPYNDLK
jgi:hypothetical protein